MFGHSVTMSVAGFRLQANIATSSEHCYCLSHCGYYHSYLSCSYPKGPNKLGNLQIEGF